MVILIASGGLAIVSIAAAAWSLCSKLISQQGEYIDYILFQKFIILFGASACVLSRLQLLSLSYIIRSFVFSSRYIFHRSCFYPSYICYTRARIDGNGSTIMHWRQAVTLHVHVYGVFVYPWPDRHTPMTNFILQQSRFIELEFFYFFANI
jgi:hypothetical protein